MCTCAAHPSGEKPVLSTGERDGRSSQIDADHRGANALLLQLYLVAVFCGE